MIKQLITKIKQLFVKPATIESVAPQTYVVEPQITDAVTTTKPAEERPAVVAKKAPRKRKPKKKPEAA